MNVETRNELRVAAVVAAGVLLAGVPAGALWRLLAPLPRLVVQSGGVFYADSETEVVVAADGWFVVVAVLAGLLAAMVVFARVRGTRIGALAGLVVGGLLGSLVAWGIGHLLGPGSITAAAKGLADGARFDGPLDLSAHGVLFVWPIASTVVYFALVAGLEPRDGAVAEGTRFPVTVLRPGYAIADVDRAFARLESGELGAEEARALRFPSSRWRQGYDEASVDAALAGRINGFHHPPGDGAVSPTEEPGGSALPGPG